MVSTIIIPQLKDNYSFIVTNNKEAIVIDPAESIPILNYINEKKLLLKAILLTHHHSDHISGVEGMLKDTKVPVYSPNKKIKYSSIIFEGKKSIDLDFIKFEIIATPGHTLDHVIFYDKKNKILFSGDTLFHLGCGKVFEGTYQQMYNSLKKINDLSNETNVYCGHEYSLNNIDFLLSIFPKNNDFLAEKEKIYSQILNKFSSIPFNLGHEKQINPFLAPYSAHYSKYKENINLSNFELFSHLRDLKNNF